MLRLKTKRGALAMYGVLLVLPTLVFGWLYWRELVRDYDAELADVPEHAEDAARRVVAGMQHRLERLLQTESERPFYHYGAVFSAVEAMGDEIAIQGSPLVDGSLPRGIRAWFTFDLIGGEDEQVSVFLGQAHPRLEREFERLSRIVGDFRQLNAAESLVERLSKLDGLDPQPLPLSTVAVSRSYSQDMRCIVSCSQHMVGRTLPVGVSDFHRQFYLDREGQPVVIVSRRVMAFPRKSDLPPEAECLGPLLEGGFALQQGFLIDTKWLLEDLPREVADQTLDESQELVPLAEVPIREIPPVFANVLPVSDLGFETLVPADESYGQLDLAIDTDRIRERFDKQSKRFLMVAVMMVLTLGTGMMLLFRSVNRELDQAHRMQNFVAAVTHELRTPLSTIRLHGEMLLDGWTTDPEKQREYHARIVRETDRLSILVERVLEKSRLKETTVTPGPGELNELISGMEPDLRSADGREDLVFELDPTLPPVMLTVEAVAGILTNLVENARKYAPVAGGGEPILVRTRTGRDGILLEVADRGPGVPSAERERIFEAFYRIGSEATRTARGTGLGLHLVALHAESVGARAMVEDREGGGSVFRVAFRRAG